MAWIVNRSQRAYNIGGVLVSPLVPVFLDDSFLSIARVKEIIAAGDLEVSSEKPVVTTPETEEGERETVTTETKTDTSELRSKYKRS